MEGRAALISCGVGYLKEVTQLLFEWQLSKKTKHVRISSEFVRLCQRRKLKINIEKSKVNKILSEGGKMRRGLVCH